MDKKSTAKGTSSRMASASTKRLTAVKKRLTMIPYGDPIREAVASGSLAQMRRLEASTVKWLEATKAQLQDVKKALRQLRSAMKDV